MNDETRLKLLEIAASLSAAVLQTGNIDRIVIPDREKWEKVDVASLFVVCVKVVKEQYELLSAQ